MTAVESAPDDTKNIENVRKGKTSDSNLMNF